MAKWYATYSDEDLQHHGVLGQKWGVRRYQNPDGSLTSTGEKRYAKRNLSKAKMYNMSKFGMDKKHNVAYIIGSSGSGKSTTANALANKNDKVIHLDSYTEKTAEQTNKYFNNFLKENNVDIKKLKDRNINVKDRFKEIDKMSYLIEKFAEKEYDKGNRVIVEGVQLADETMFPNKEYFNGKCVVFMNNNYAKNSLRAMSRDNVSINNKIKQLFDKERINWYSIANKTLKEIDKNNKQYKDAKDIIDKLIKEA